MKRRFRKRMVGDFVVSYEEMLGEENTVIMGVINCNKRELEKVFNGIIPEYLDLEISLKLLL